MKNKEFKIQDSISGKKKSKMQKYMDLIIGSNSYMDLLKYELITIFISIIPGALGVFLRSKFFPLLLGSVGAGTVFGANIVFRHPKKIHLGKNVVIDDNVLIDAKGGDNLGIKMGDDVFIGRNSILSCKGGDIILDERANLGANCYIFSSNKVKLGKDVIVAAYTYFVGGGNYNLDQIEVPINQQYNFEGKGGVDVEDNVWIGAHVVILDGVKVGSGSVLAAGAIVSKDVPRMSIVG
ncbi:MAG: acyltransferase, partial [Ignavibacteriae bacterium]|nr:acyltransferase [Ignavibacteriota bacterium]